MVMLKRIPKILSPELLSVLARMGHGDEIVLADANFPSASTSKAGPEIVSKTLLTATRELASLLECPVISTFF